MPSTGGIPIHSTMACDLLSKHYSAHPGFWERHTRLLLSSCFTVILMACGSAAVVATIAQAPADSLSLAITIRNQYTTTTSDVTLSLIFRKDGKEVDLGSNMHMACDGVQFSYQNGALRPVVSLPRQPAGGAYQCTYTDEKGNKTSLTIPILAGRLAITSPLAGATVQPSEQIVATPVVLPTPTPNGSPTPTAPPPPVTPTPSGSPTPTAPPPPVTPTIPGALALTKGIDIHYTLPILPAHASAQVSLFASCGGDSDACGTVYGPLVPATGDYILTDTTSSTGFGFDAFPSGSPGEIQLTSILSWSLPPGGFQSMSMTYTDLLSIPVIWSRA